MAIKRLHYYDQQFLVEADFTDEQAYHMGMRRRLTRLLHTPGIATGLAVQNSGAHQVTVKTGAAVDGQGREIVLEADQVLDLSNAATFPAGATVFVTAAYQEGQTDPSTATGAPGNTRFTEQPLLSASTTAPAVDFSVVPLARFDLTATGNVPGILNDVLDGGVRQATGAKLAGGAVSEANLDAALKAKVNTPGGVLSVDGVSNPGGNIDLVAAQAISLAPDDAGNRIVIGESHSARTDNPHATTAAQVGALPTTQYELAKRQLGLIQFTQADATGATRTITLGFPPRMMLAIGQCRATLGTRSYGGGSVGFFETISGQQRCFGFGMTRNTDTDWFVRSVGVPTTGVCGAVFTDNGAAPVQSEALLVSVTPTPTGLTATLTRTLVGAGVALGTFQLEVNLFGMGA